MERLVDAQFLITRLALSRDSPDGATVQDLGELEDEILVRLQKEAVAVFRSSIDMVKVCTIWDPDRSCFVRFHVAALPPSEVKTVSDSIFPRVSRYHRQRRVQIVGISLTALSIVFSMLVFTEVVTTSWVCFLSFGGTPYVITMASGFSLTVLKRLMKTFQTLYVWFQTFAMFTSFRILWRNQPLKTMFLAFFMPALLTTLVWMHTPKLVALELRRFSFLSTSLDCAFSCTVFCKAHLLMTSPFLFLTGHVQFLPWQARP